MLVKIYASEDICLGWIYSKCVNTHKLLYTSIVYTITKIQL